MSLLDSFRLDDETAIVTGAAQGLGKQMASALAEVGADVAIADVNAEGAATTAQELDGETDVISVEVDVTDEDEVIAMVDEVSERLGPIDVLINNAGIPANDAVEDMTLELWRRTLEVNLTGVFLCSKYVGQKMLERETGRIVNISSISGIDVNVPQKQAGYNASKAGVSQLTKSMAVEWADRGVRVNAIAPGYMRTEIIDGVLAPNPDREQMWIENTPMRRLGQPEELKEIAVYLSTEASSYTTGTIIPVDGGYTSV